MDKKHFLLNRLWWYLEARYHFVILKVKSAFHRLCLHMFSDRVFEAQCKMLNFESHHAFAETLLEVSGRIGFRDTGLDHFVIEVQRIACEVLNVPNVKLHIFDSHAMNRFTVEEINVCDDKLSAIQFVRHSVDLHLMDAVGICMVEATRDASLEWMLGDEEGLDSDCIPLRAYPDHNIIGILELPIVISSYHEGAQKSMATSIRRMSVNSQKRTKAEIIMFCHQISGPLQLVQKLETNQILALRRFYMRVAHRRMEKAFTAWNRYHLRLIQGRKRRLKVVNLIEMIHSRHNKRCEYSTLVAWMRLAMKQRGERLRDTQIELEAIRKAVPNDDEIDI